MGSAQKLTSNPGNVGFEMKSVFPIVKFISSEIKWVGIACY